MAAPLAEVREADAPPEIAGLYARIRQVAGLPQVNLIYRHLATLPGVLPWVWQRLEPLYASDRLRDAVERLRRTLPSDDLEPLWTDLPSADRREVERVLAFYERANAQNAITLTALRLFFLESGGRARTALVPPAVSMPALPSPSTPAALVALPRLADLDGDVRDRVRALAGLHPDARDGVTPSLYLHLAPWPPMLERAFERLSGYVGSATWALRKSALLRDLQSEAETTGECLRSVEPLPDREGLQPGLDAIARFVHGTIPEMLLVGAQLSGRRVTASPQR